MFSLREYREPNLAHMMPVINLAVDKGRVFREAARLLRKDGRLAIADIVTDVSLPESVVCNADLCVQDLRAGEAFCACRRANQEVH